MAEPAYPSLEQEQGKIGFEGIAEQTQEGGSFSVQFTPSSGESKQQLNEETQPSYRTFEGDQPVQASSEDINLLEKGDSPSEKEKVNWPTVNVGAIAAVACVKFRSPRGRSLL